MGGCSCWSAPGDPFGSMAISGDDNDLRLPEGFHMRKFTDDTTISEVVPASKHSSPQQAADYIHDWSQENHLQLNSTKCKGDPHVLQAHSPCFCQVSIEGVEFEMVSSAKVLGVIIINGLHISTQSRHKAAKRLYLLRQRKRAGIAHNDLVRFYCSVIRSVLEHACQVFHCSLPLYLWDEIERIQYRALRAIFPGCYYNEGLGKAGLPTLYDRRRTLCKALFNKIAHGIHKLSHLFPSRSQQMYNLRSGRTFTAPVCKTNRLRDIFPRSTVQRQRCSDESKNRQKK